MIMRAANPLGFARIVKEGKVALAKLGTHPGPFPFKLWEDSYGGQAEAQVTSSAAVATGGTRGAQRGA